MHSEVRYPASSNQQAVWLFSRMFPDNSAYNLLWEVKLSGQLDMPRLLQSLQTLLDRHESLRTCFSLDNDELLQVVTSRLAVDCELDYLLGRSAEEKRDQLGALSWRFGSALFDLERGPLIRFRLVRVDHDDHRLLVSLHHMVTDGSSWPIFVDELAALYAATTLPTLPMQYGDYAIWQKRMLDDGSWLPHEAYWKKTLGETFPILDLPADHPRSQVRSLRGAVCQQMLSPELTVALRSVRKEHGSTLFKLMLAAFNVLLHKLTGETDLIVGTTLTGRTLEEISDGIGFFVNTAALRTRIGGNPSFLDVLSQVQLTLDQAVLHQTYPFDEVIRWASPVGDLSREPLSAVNFTKLPPPVERRVGPLTFSEDRIFLDAETHDLTVYTQETAKGIRLTWVYNADLFEQTTMVRTLTCFQTLLEGIATDPHRSISKLSLVNQSERHRMLVEWNATKRDYPQEKCIHQLFEAEVERVPDATAVVFENQAVTYGELNSRANQLANYLQNLGVGPDVLVGICMERSIEMIVGVLGILKAGGGYVPLDPEYPDERLAFILKDTRAAVLLTKKALVDDRRWRIEDRDPRFLRHGSGQASILDLQPRIICLDSDWQAIERESKENLDKHAAAENVAYVIYTSGSTGEPKGATISHRSLVNAALGWEDAYSLRQAATCHLQMASFSFDVFTADLVRSLCFGGKLVLCQQELLLFPAKLYELMRRHRIDSAEFVPVVLRELIQHLNETGQDLHFMRLLIVGSDAWYVKEHRELQRLGGPQCRIINSYGMTEATIDSLYFEGVMDDLAESEVVPIGRPFANAQTYILDSFLQPVPVEVAGELYLGGPSLARGYLNRGDLTAERFVPDFLSGEPGARLYRTGDRARYLPDGNIEFLGRVDHQVKIRGIRLELGEIEMALKQHPDVRDCAVLACADVFGGASLVAYVVSGQKPDPAISDLRGFLQRKLPEYMVPSYFMRLAALPRSPNGKLDRRALPESDLLSLHAGRVFIGPRTPVEQALEEIWRKVLKLEQIGIHDNFFELGGHSLKASQVISRIRETFQADLSLRAVFTAPTVAGLAERVEAALRTEQGLQVLPPLNPSSRDRNLPLSFAQQRLWFLDQLDPGSPVYIIPCAIQLTGPLDLAALERSFNELARRHESLRTTFPVIDGNPEQFIAPTLTFVLAVKNLQGTPEAERQLTVDRLSTEEAIRPLDLAEGPLWRATVLRFHDDDHVLLFNMHHIVSDGWSMGVLFRELSALYEAFCEGRPLPLNDLRIQYADYALWQRDWLQGDALEQQLAYWKQQLASAPALLELPTDRPRPRIQSFRGARHPLTFPRELSRALKVLSNSEGVTLFMTLLAAFKVLLSRYAGQSDIVLGAPIAGRSQADTEELIGLFINTLVLRSDLSGDPTFRTLLKRVKDVALGAYAHQDLPFEKLVEALQPERDLSYNPLFQVFFALHNFSPALLILPGISSTPLDVHNGVARFDLALDLVERSDGLTGSLEYNADLFDLATITRMAGHFQTLLEGIVANPEKHISELPILTEVEKHQLLFAWNETNRDYPTDQCVHELFEAQVERSPDAVAVVFEDKELTYRELNCRANQLARYLQKLGVGPEVLVAIFMERSPEMFVGLLGVLKAGGAYVPLDPEYPEERLAFMLEDSQAVVLVTEERLLEKLVENRGLKIDDRDLRSLRPCSGQASILDSRTKVVCLDRDWKDIERESDNNPESEVTPENLGYVIYTSGSTGKPKGVLGLHRGLLNRFSWMWERYPFELAEVCCQKTSLNFVDSLWELLAPLVQGIRTVIISDRIVRDPSLLIQTLAAHNVSRIVLVPSLLGVLLDTQRDINARLPNLKLCIASGEALRKDLVKSFADLIPNGKLLNLYGSSEISADVTCYDTSRGEGTGPGVPIGRPIANTRVYLLDAGGQPVPIGVAGQLYVGGDGLARGYLNHAELTADKFIPDPFSDKPGDVLYNTGDLAYYRPDGNIEFLGRLDRQVKIRGFRIELDEIEAVLGQHPSVRETVVVVQEDVYGDSSSEFTLRRTKGVTKAKRLLAYIVPSGERSYSTSELRSFLKQKLPDYMVPSTFVVLASLPLTPNGKVDRKALPVPDQSPRELEGHYQGPETPIQALLADIWAEVLKVKRVGIQDNFFDMGGHSLLATQVVARIRQLLGTEVPVRLIFEAPTIEAFAATMVTNQGKVIREGTLEPLLCQLETMSDEEAVQQLIADSK